MGTVSKVGDHIFNLFDLINFTLETDHDKAPVIPFGPLSILSSITGMMLAESESDYKMWEEQTVIQDLEEAKVKGLDAVRDFIDSWDHHDDYQWELLPVSSATAPIVRSFPSPEFPRRGRNPEVSCMQKMCGGYTVAAELTGLLGFKKFFIRYGTKTILPMPHFLIWSRCHHRLFLFKTIL